MNKLTKLLRGIATRIAALIFIEQSLYLDSSGSNFSVPNCPDIIHETAGGSCLETAVCLFKQFSDYEIRQKNLTSLEHKTICAVNYHTLKVQ